MATRFLSLLPLLLAGVLLTGCAGTGYRTIHGSAPDAAAAAKDAADLYDSAERIRNGKTPYLRRDLCVLVRCEPVVSYQAGIGETEACMLGRVVYAPERACVSVGDPVHVCTSVNSDPHGPGYRLPESERVSWVILTGRPEWWEKAGNGLWRFCDDTLCSFWYAQYLADYKGPLWPEWDRMREIIRKDDGRPVHAPLPFTRPTAQNDDFSPCDDAAAQRRVENALRLSTGKELVLAELWAVPAFHAVREELSIPHWLRSGRIIYTTPGAKALLGADVDYHRPADDWSPRKDNVHDISTEPSGRKAYVVFYGDPASQLQPRFGRAAMRETRWAPGTALEARDLLRYQGDLPAPWAAVRNRILREMPRK